MVKKSKPLSRATDVSVSVTALDASPENNNMEQKAKRPVTDVVVDVDEPTFMVVGPGLPAEPTPTAQHMSTHTRPPQHTGGCTAHGHDTRHRHSPGMVQK